MVGWIQMMYGIQRYYNEEIQVKFKYGCGPIMADITCKKKI
jgi:hypothetical protein